MAASAAFQPRLRGSPRVFPANQTILFPTDFSKHSDDALDWAINNMTVAGDRLLLYHVIAESEKEQDKSASQDDVGMIFDDSTPVKTSQIHEARDKMNELVARVTKMVEMMEDVSVEGLIEFGAPNEAILAKTKAIRPRFVVVGTRGTNASWRGWV